MWKGRQCVMTSSGDLSLVVYDYINQQVVNTFQTSCFPNNDSVEYICSLSEKNVLVCFGSFGFASVVVLSLDDSSEFFASPFINHRKYPVLFALSPDNLYAACSYGYPTLKIMDVDAGQTLQTIAPKQKPIACWWSKLYLWVVCKDLLVIKYPYNSIQTQILGNYVQECCIDCKGRRLLKFAEGVLVTLMDEKICISKICHEHLCPQQILDSTFNSFCSVAISSDGCAVLLYDKNNSNSYCELWEMGYEDKWELFSIEWLEYKTEYACLTGKQNFRSFVRIQGYYDDGEYTNSIDVQNVSWKSLAFDLPHFISVRKIIYVEPELLICHSCKAVYFIHASGSKVFATIDVGDIDDFFFVPSKHLLLLFVGSGVIKHFKVHNLHKYLPL